MKLTQMLELAIIVFIIVVVVICCAMGQNYQHIFTHFDNVIFFFHLIVLTQHL